MSWTEVNAGAVVEVLIKDTVKEVAETEQHFEIAFTSGCVTRIVKGLALANVTLVEKGYTPGDVVRDANGGRLFRIKDGANGCWINASGRRLHDNEIDVKYLKRIEEKR